METVRRKRHRRCDWFGNGRPSRSLAGFRNESQSTHAEVTCAVSQSDTSLLVRVSRGAVHVEAGRRRFIRRLQS